METYREIIWYHSGTRFWKYIGAITCNLKGEIIFDTEGAPLGRPGITSC